VPIAISSTMPTGAIPLITGQPGQMEGTWYQRYTKNPAPWTVGADGVASPAAAPKKCDITSKQEFGDSYVHVEFRQMLDSNGKSIGHGNSGVGLQGRYEIQIMDSYGHALEKHECASLYSQKAARVNVCKKAGEWQTFDIIFRAPRFDDAGKVTEAARATVFQNGVLVQNNEAFEGPTGIQYGEFKGESKTGPLILQGDHDPVQFRNVWIVPL